MVMWRNHLPDSRGLEEGLGGESGVACEETESGESYREKKGVDRGQGLTLAALVHA